MAFNQAQENKYVNRGLQTVPTNEITKLKLQGNIILGDFIFNTIDEFGVVWVVTDMPGWWKHPAAEMPEIDRGYGDGAYDVQGRYKARQFELQGTFLVDDPTKVEAARDRLIRATDLVYKGAWLKTGTNPIRASYVRLSGDVEIETVNVRGRTNFSIGLRAFDPIKYSWNDTNEDGYDVVEIPSLSVSIPGSGVGVVNNIGNYPVPCYLELSGPIVSPASIYNRTTNQEIVIVNSLKGSLSRSVVNKQLSYSADVNQDVATLTTVEKHGYVVGDTVYISGVGDEFDGEAQIISVPTDTTFTYYTSVAEIKNIAFKELLGGIATIQTTADHGFSVGENVTVSGVDSVFDGTYAVASVPTANTLTYIKTRLAPQQITAASLVSNIATLTTATPHDFIVGESVTVTGSGVNYNGTFVITSIPTPTQFSYAATRTNARGIVNKAMSNDIVTLTTGGAHGFITGENVNITNVDLSLNGGYTILDTPTTSTFRYRRVRPTQVAVSVKALSSNVATITTATPHGFAVGEKVVVSDVDGTFNGTYTITSLPSNTTFTYAKTGSNLISTVSTGNVYSKSRVVKFRSLVGNVATIVTQAAHGVILGEQVTVSGVGTEFDGTYEVTSIPTTTSFTYNKVGANVAYGAAPATNAFVEMSGTITSASVTPDGLATVSGSLPASSVSGTATSSATIARTETGGRAIKKNDVIFTPGLRNAVAVRSADILEIDTKNREVAFNGELEGARGKIEVLADFIELAPGENIIEVSDEGSAESTATLRVFYRSGWLG